MEAMRDDIEPVAAFAKEAGVFREHLFTTANGARADVEVGVRGNAWVDDLAE